MPTNQNDKTPDKTLAEKREDVKNYVNPHPDCADARFSDAHADTAVKTVSDGVGLLTARPVKNVVTVIATAETGPVAAPIIAAVVAKVVKDQVADQAKPFAENVVTAIDGVRMQECSRPKHEYDAMVAQEQAKKAEAAKVEQQRIDAIKERLQSPAAVNIAQAPKVDTSADSANRRLNNIMNQFQARPTPAPVHFSAPRPAPRPNPTPIPRPNLPPMNTIMPSRPPAPRNNPAPMNFKINAPRPAPLPSALRVGPRR